MVEHTLVDVLVLVAKRLHVAVHLVELVEGEHDERGSLLVRAGDDVLVDRLQVGDGRHGPDRHAAQLLVRLEGDNELVAVPVAVASLVPEWHAVSPRFVDHGDGGRSLRELDEVHGVDGYATLPCAARAVPGKLEALYDTKK